MKHYEQFIYAIYDTDKDTFIDVCEAIEDVASDLNITIKHLKQVLSPAHYKGKMICNKWVFSYDKRFW